MGDSRELIPALSFLNGVILSQVVTIPEVITASQNVASSAWGDSVPRDFSLLNPAHVAGMLYCLFVVPREFFAAERDQGRLDAIRQLGLSSRFVIHEYDPQFVVDPEVQLVRRMRNAVAHANFSIGSSGQFEFWDGKPGGPKSWRACIGWDDLQYVLTKMGHVYGSAPAG